MSQGDNRTYKEIFGTERDLDLCQKQAQGIKLAIGEAERMLALTTQLGYKEAYLQAFRDYLTYLRPMYERVLRGEYPNPITRAE